MVMTQRVPFERNSLVIKRAPVAEISPIEARKSVNVSFSSTLTGMYLRRRRTPAGFRFSVSATGHRGAREKVGQDSRSPGSVKSHSTRTPLT